LSTVTPRPFDVAATAALARIPAACARRGPGWCAAAACILEASAAKPGNVHPGEDFADLSYDELVAAALAIAPIMDRAAHEPLGRTIRDAVAASCRVTRSNANLGMILAIAPLAAASAAGPAAVLSAASARDAVDVWEAIRLARPGGLGAATRWDVLGPAPPDIVEAMRLAAPHDLVARLWAEDYAPLDAGPVRDLAAELSRGTNLEDAIIRTHLRQLAREPDSLIARRHGAAVAAEVSTRAAAALATGPEPSSLADFDRFLRSPRRLNPGTTADLVAAALYILLRDHAPCPALDFPAVP
jgi:triphosphoribosyl-dephospho-CoA synthase